MTQQSSVISADKLSKSYGKTQALNGLSFTVDQPGVTAMLGANGAGKTTFINCALGLNSPSKGQIRILGHKAGSIQARKRTGVMLQDGDLPDLLTAREHIQLMASYYDNPYSIGELISLCDLGSFADKKYKKLSGGQKRRVQFALALTGKPDLIFLDEPTTGLDSDSRRSLWKIVRELADAGRTIILTTHYLEEADNLANRIAVLNKGEIIADGPTDDIRNAVGGALIRCVTKLGRSQIETMPAVRLVRESGRYMEVLTNDQTETLKALLQADPELSDLAIAKPTLEEAFLNLMTRSEGGSQ